MTDERIDPKAIEAAAKAAHEAERLLYVESGEESPPRRTVSAEHGFEPALSLDGKSRGLMSLDTNEIEELKEAMEGAKIDLLPERVALTAEQVEEHNLETAPPKRSDSRSANWIGDTCQLEAMPPDVLASTVREAIEGHLDLERYEEEREREQADEEQIERGLELAREA